MKKIEINTSPTKTAKTSPFRVPEGYFDQLKADVMARVAADANATAADANVVEMEPTHTPHRLLRPIIGVAASVCVAIFGVSVYMHNNDAGASATEEPAQAEMLFASDDASDYIMLDNEDIYRYLCGIE